MVMQIDAVARQWGDSLAVIIPKQVVAAEMIRPKDRIHLIIQKEHDLQDLFGKFKTKKTPQQLKDESRSGWE